MLAACIYPHLLIYVDVPRHRLFFDATCVFPFVLTLGRGVCVCVSQSVDDDEISQIITIIIIIIKK